MEKSGDLVIADTAEDEKNDSDEVIVTIGFDKMHHARVLKTEFTAAHYLTSGDSLELEGKDDEAIAEFTRALEVDKKSTEACFRRGAVKEAKGDFKGAIADYEAAMKIDPNVSGAYDSRAGVKELQGDIDGAITDYTHAVDSNPQDADWAYMGRAGAYYLKGSRADALADL